MRSISCLFAVFNRLFCVLFLPYHFKVNSRLDWRFSRAFSPTSSSVPCTNYLEKRILFEVRSFNTMRRYYFGFWFEWAVLPLELVSSAPRLNEQWNGRRAGVSFVAQKPLGCRLRLQFLAARRYKHTVLPIGKHCNKIVNSGCLKQFTTRLHDVHLQFHGNFPKTGPVRRLFVFRGAGGPQSSH